MVYYTKVLLPDEIVLFVGKIHWLIYVRACFFLLLALVAAAAAFSSFTVSDMPPDAVRQVLDVLALALAAFAFLSWLSAWIRRATTEIVVTDRRIIFKRGFIRRASLEMTMTKVETVDVVQSITGRIFNYGNVIIRGSGSTYEPLVMVQEPLKLRTAIVAH